MKLHHFNGTKYTLLQAALRLASHEYDAPDDPGWQAELDNEIFEQAARDYVAELDGSKGERT